MPAEGLAFEGVSLEQFAGVGAALAEKLPLPEILTQEQIESEAWPKAERAWRQALVESTDLQLTYMDKRRTAEDCLARKLDPVDREPHAWAGLLSAVTHGDRNAVLAKLGLTMTDVARLGRSWRRKAAEDAAVAEQLADTDKAALPAAVKAEEAKLRPFPWTPAPPQVAEQKARELEPSAEPFEGSSESPKQVQASFQIAAVAGANEPDFDPDATQAPVAAAPRSLPFRKGPVVTPPAHELAEQSGETSFGTIAALSKESVGVDETVLIRSPYAQKPATPFSGTTTQERLAAVAAAPEEKTEDQSGATMMAPSPFAANAPTPFERPATASEEDFTIERYAALRAELMVHGEEHLPTLQSYGLPSVAALMRLRARFAAVFARDRGAQDEFMRALSAHTGSGKEL